MQQKIGHLNYTWTIINNLEATTRGFLCKKMFLEISQNSPENTCGGVSFLIKLQAYFIKKETLAQVFSCGFCESFKDTFFTEHLWTTASDNWYDNEPKLVLRRSKWRSSK